MMGIYQQAQILILEILIVCLWLKLSPSLSLNKIEQGLDAFCSDRSSDFPALLAAFPSIFEKWHTKAKRVPFPN